MEVLLKITSVQQFRDEKPETTQLVTEGTLSQEDGAWLLSYAESELTGMAGTMTTFRIEPEQITLLRSGTIESKMVFVTGVEDRSLYDMGFGALMVAVCAERIVSTVGENGGVLEVSYGITIEEETAGTIDYRIEAMPKKGETL